MLRMGDGTVLWLADFRFRLDNVLVNGVGGVVKVPMGWFAQYGLDDVGMAMAYSDSMSGESIAKTDALPRSLYESYVAGLDPTNSFERFEVNISVVEGKPFLTWSPDLGNERVYTIWGSADLAVDSWHSPTNAYDRFFKVKVEMP